MIKKLSKGQKSLCCDDFYWDSQGISPLLCITYNCITHMIMQFQCELPQWVSVYWLRGLSKQWLLAQGTDSLLAAVQTTAPKKQHCQAATFNMGFLRKKKSIILLPKPSCPSGGTVQEVQMSQTEENIHSHLCCQLSGSSCSSKSHAIVPFLSQGWLRSKLLTCDFTGNSMRHEPGHGSAGPFE